jgi:hypothetical protein
MFKAKHVVSACIFCIVFCELNAQISYSNESGKADAQCGSRAPQTAKIVAPWMLEMRARGVKAVDAEASFAWDQEVKDFSVTNLSYYSAYSASNARLLDTLTTADDFSRQLSVAAGPIIREQLERLVPPELSRRGLKRAKGFIVVTFFDDACLGARGALSDITDPDITPLVASAISDNLPALSSLLEQGVEVNAQDQRGLTALMAASMAGDKDAVRILLEHRANVNVADVDGRTALHYAAGQVDASGVILLLLKAGADKNSKLSSTAKHLAGATPLVVAAGVGNVNAVRLLVDAGADTTALTHDGRSALDIARDPPMLPRSEQSEVIAILAKAAHKRN